MESNRDSYVIEFKYMKIYDSFLEQNNCRAICKFETNKERGGRKERCNKLGIDISTIPR